MAIPPLVWTAVLILAGSPRPYGLDHRPEFRGFPGIASDARAPFPALLSRAGVFRDLRSLTPDEALLPYDLIVPFWSDGATKARWIAVPREPIGFSPDGEWSFPAGTVFVKHFELGLDDRNPARSRRLETRLLVVGPSGAVRGASYRWRPDRSDADLVPELRTESIAIRTAEGERTQVWSYPGPADCLQCHTAVAGGVLGVKTRQLDGEYRYPSGVTDNQLRTWNHLGLFDRTLADLEITRFPRLAKLDDPGHPLEDRARSYLDANCAQCHRPGGVAADFDARFGTPPAKQRILGEPARINLGIDGARIVAPNDPWRSALLTRLESTEPVKMPPLAHQVVDARGAALLRAWIASLPGPPVVAPPSIEPKGGDLKGPVRVSIAHPDPAAVVRYTLDGSAPGKSSPVYDGPLAIDRSTTVRARAYREGSTRSIVAQETFILGD